VKQNYKIGALGIVLIVLTSIALKAQNLPEFGVRVGINSATITNLEGTDRKTGLLAGFYIEFDIPESQSSVQPELIYVQYGGKDANSDASQLFSYLQIPVLLKIGFGNEEVKPNMFFGPYLGFSVKSEFDNGSGGTIDLVGAVNDIDYGMVLGAGVDGDKFQLSLRYTAGLNNIYDESIEDGEKNSAIALVFGIAF